MRKTFTRRAFIQTSLAALASAAIPACVSNAPGTTVPTDALLGLKDAAAQKNILYGAAAVPTYLDEPDFVEALMRECAVLVPEGSLVVQDLRPTPDQWNFAGLDKAVDFAAAHNMKVRCNPIIWHFGLPAWLTHRLKSNQKSAGRLFEEHIHTLVSRYKGRVLSWDVVNEATHPVDKLPRGMRRSPWYGALGPSYVERAFKVAAAADPQAILVYNDFGMDYDPMKAKAVLALLRRLKDRHVPVHAVGIQGHLSVGQGFGPLESFCVGVRDLGLDLFITELDVRESSVPIKDIPARDWLVAQTVRRFLDTVFSITTPKQVLTWGLTDKHSWLSVPQFNADNPYGAHIRSLPLDEDYKRTDFWKVLYERFGGYTS